MYLMEVIYITTLDLCSTVWHVNLLYSTAGWPLDWVAYYLRHLLDRKLNKILLYLLGKGLILSLLVSNMAVTVLKKKSIIKPVSIINRLWHYIYFQKYFTHSYEFCMILKLQFWVNKLFINCIWAIKIIVKQFLEQNYVLLNEL